MKREKKKLKMMALSAVLAAGMLLPMMAMAQFSKNENFFESSTGGSRSGGTEYYNLSNQQFGAGSSSDGYNLSNQQFGAAPVPLGSGLLIMVAAGMGYAILKRKNELTKF